jgi:hypothetical protein
MIQAKSFSKMEKPVNHNKLMKINHNHNQQWNEEKEDTEAAKRWTETKVIWVGIKDINHRVITMVDSAMDMRYQTTAINKPAVEAIPLTKEERALPNQKRKASSNPLK